MANILAEAGIEPAPEREKKRTWMRFIKMHWESLYACDFFSVDVLGIFGTVRQMVFFVIEIKTRAVEIAGIEVDPAEKRNRAAFGSRSSPPPSCRAKRARLSPNRAATLLLSLDATFP